MKHYTVLLFLLATLGLHAQDTIVYRNGLKTPVLLKEISPTEIRYQRADMSGGPDYVISKSDVAKLIYKNGMTETIALSATTESQVVTSSAASILNVQQGKLTYRDTKRNYKSLQQLVLSHPDSKRQPELSQLAKDIRHHKQVQDATRTGAIVCGGVAIGGTVLFGFSYLLTNGDVEPAFAIPPVVLSVAAISIGTAAIIHNGRLRSKRQEFVNLYNE